LGYNSVFTVHRRDNSQTARDYVFGLLKCEKGHANMERIEEEIDRSNYRAYHHFISNSKWDYKELIKKLSIDASNTLKANKSKSKVSTGYIIDESAHLKKGDESIAVAKQYAGVVGKVENCQVGVYSSLVNDNLTTIINERLFLPKSWASSKQRCDKVEIPEENRIYKTKPELALEMVDEDIANGVEFDWIGGDGLYGHSSQLTKGLDERGKLYVLDVHKDELVFLEEPHVIESAAGMEFNTEPIRVDHYMENLDHLDWVKVNVRKTAKGWLKLKVHVVDVWVWDEVDKQARSRTLVITRTKAKRPETKYSFSNGGAGTYHPKEYAYFQSQRYWVERAFDDSKNELGMSDYQIRKWIGWHHHQSLVMFASLYLLKQKIDNVNDFPLMSIRDARILIIFKMFGTEEQYEKRLEQMKIRHRKRKHDIERYYRKEDTWEDI